MIGYLNKYPVDLLYSCCLF